VNCLPCNGTQTHKRDRPWSYDLLGCPTGSDRCLPTRHRGSARRGHPWVVVGGQLHRSLIASASRAQIAAPCVSILAGRLPAGRSEDLTDVDPAGNEVAAIGALRSVAFSPSALWGPTGQRRLRAGRSPTASPDSDLDLLVRTPHSLGGTEPLGVATTSTGWTSASTARSKPDGSNRIAGASLHQPRRLAKTPLGSAWCGALAVR
jgi:hypothetical protein